MGNTKKVITIDDVHQLVDIKYKNPQIAPEDLYRHVDRIRPDNSKEMWKLLWMPISLAVLSILGMLFFSEDKECRVWHRCSIIGFVIASVWGFLLLKKFERWWWWIPILDVVILYLIFAETLSVTELIQHIIALL